MADLATVEGIKDWVLALLVGRRRWMRRLS